MSIQHPIQPIFLLLQEHLPEDPGLWNIIVHSNLLNFLLAVAILYWIFKRLNVGSFLETRQTAIVKELKDAEEKRAQAMRDLEILEKRAAKLNEEVETLLVEARSTAESVGQSIVKNAEEEAAKIISNAQKRIVLEQKTASRELEQRLMREAIHAAQQLLESTLSDKDRHHSVEDFVATLPELYQKEL